MKKKYESLAFKCANRKCGRELTRDHVIMITTMHMRRFCSVECIAEGQRASRMDKGPETIVSRK